MSNKTSMTTKLAQAMAKAFNKPEVYYWQARVDTFSFPYVRLDGQFDFCKIAETLLKVLEEDDSEKTE